MTNNILNLSSGTLPPLGFPAFAKLPLLSKNIRLSINNKKKLEDLEQAKDKNHCAMQWPMMRLLRITIIGDIIQKKVVHMICTCRVHLSDRLKKNF
jgi:hypothetical protein